MTFAAIRNAFRLGPKTLDQATSNLDAAAAQLDSVSALFAAAGLNLETMLAAGPDALKAHLAGLSAKDGELATAQAKIIDLEGKVSAAAELATANDGKFSALVTALAPVGITASTKPEDFSALLSAHVKKGAAIELAKTGHQALTETVSTATTVTTTVDPKLTGRDRYKAAFEQQLGASARK